MRRSKAGLIVTLALGLLAAPPAAAAQQPRKVYRIGWLQPAPLSRARQEGFLQGLRDLGYIEGKDFIIEYRWEEGRFDRMQALATELVRLNVDIIVSSNTAALLAIKRATTTIPVVMLNPGDPIATGIVEGLARPGGNITGVTQMASELNGKRLELLKEIVPNLSRVAFLTNSANPSVTLSLRQTEVAAGVLGVSVQALDVRAPDELQRAFSAFTRGRAQALVVPPDSTRLSQRRHIVDLAAKGRLPAMYSYREFVDSGGLIAYAPHGTDQFRRAATYVDKILKGAKPADLPVEQPTRFELVINLKTAKALGVTIPQSVLVRADQVIQ
jgi:putative ABC transport system substrate-binding protein